MSARRPTSEIGRRGRSAIRVVRRVVVLAALALAAIPALPAQAHPLGNFSINHLVEVRISANQVDLHYVLDQAEIPTFQERGLSNATVLSRKRAEVERHLNVLVDGRAAPLHFLPRSSLSHPPGQGGLPLTRAELWLAATVRAPHSVKVSDQTFPGRIGWKAIVIRPGAGTDVRSNVPSTDPTHALRSYPQDMLSSPLDQRTASFHVSAGTGGVIAPNGHISGATTQNRAGDGFAGVFADAAAGKGVLLFLLLAAFAWGAIHALSPGHGKTMVAAYLVGTRGTIRHAVALGATVTITHTIGVFALGVVTLALSQYILPELLYPWLNLASGLLVLIIGASVLRARIAAARAPRAPAGNDHHHTGDHHHGADDHHGSDHHDGSDHHHGSDDRAGGDHHHGSGHLDGGDHHHSSDHLDGGDHHHQHNGRHHSHHPPDRITWKGVIAMGASAGLLPCPSALVVLLGAIAQHQIALGLLMIIVFSLGLACTLTALGIAVVSAGKLTSRLNVSSRITLALPAVSALVILIAGVVLTVKAVPQLS